MRRRRVDVSTVATAASIRQNKIARDRIRCLCQARDRSGDEARGVVVSDTKTSEASPADDDDVVIEELGRKASEAAATKKPEKRCDARRPHATRAIRFMNALKPVTTSRDEMSRSFYHQIDFSPSEPLRTWICIWR